MFPIVCNFIFLHCFSKCGIFLLPNYCLFSSQTCGQICRVWLDQIAHCHVKMSHSLCGHFVTKTPSGILECNLCRYSCDTEVMRTFHLKITLADESAKVFAWCTGQTAAELLQISADEFHELPEVIYELMKCFFSSYVLVSPAT